MDLTRRQLMGVALAAALPRPARAEPEGRGDRSEEGAGAMVTTRDIREYLLDNSPWVDRERTVDTVKSGDPSRPVRKAGVCWYPSIWDIQAAVAAGCDLLIAHEPTFWHHSQDEQPWRMRGPGVAKSQALEESGLVILRAHDTWDNWPQDGIRDSWARLLELGEPIREGSELRLTALYSVEEQKLKRFARHVARRIRELGEDAVQVMGDPDRLVRRVAVGVGCVVPDQEMVEAGADVLIVCFDGASYWAHRERNVEAGAAIISVEHGASETPGLMALRDHLAVRFPSVDFVFIAEHPRTWTVRAD